MARIRTRDGAEAFRVMGSRDGAGDHRGLAFARAGSRVVAAEGSASRTRLFQRASASRTRATAARGWCMTSAASSRSTL